MHTSKHKDHVGLSGLVYVFHTPAKSLAAAESRLGAFVKQMPLVQLRLDPKPISSKP